MGQRLKPQLYFILLGYVGKHRITEKNMGFGVRPHLAFSFFHLEDEKQLYFRCCKDFFNENDGNSSYIVNIYYLLTTLSAEHVTSVSI